MLCAVCCVLCVVVCAVCCVCVGVCTSLCVCVSVMACVVSTQAYVLHAQQHVLSELMGTDGVSANCQAAG